MSDTTKTKQDSDKPDSPSFPLLYAYAIPETQQDFTRKDEAVTRRQKKRIRISKKDIPEYHWTQQADTRLADLMKEHPMLYDKKQKEWLNVATKSSQWNRVGEQMELPATGDQCKKHYENMRTRLGKILKKEKKSGAGQPDRTIRDEEIMQTWSFLKQHIVRGETMSSQQFATTESAAVMTSDDEYESTESQASINSKGRRQPAIETATRTDNTVLTQSFSDAVKKILSKADSLGDSHSFTGHQKIIHDFACLLEGHMQAIPESKWHEFQIDCLNLVHRYKQHQQQPMTWLAPQSQQPLPLHQQLWHLAPQQPQPHPAATWIPTLSP